jgi:lysozyme
MAIVPSKRPQQTREETAAIFAQNLVTPPDNGVILLGVRAYYADTFGRKDKNDQGVYDDAVFIYSPTVHRGFNFNTDPQKAGQKKAMLAAGKYEFYKGRHKNKYNALRPFPEGKQLPCTRDGVTSLCSHTNIHKGGFSDTFSEGCQTLYPTQWNEFINLVYAEMTKYGQKTIRYLLIENAG